MFLKYAIRGVIFFALFLTMEPSQAQLDFSQAKEFIIHSDSIEMRFSIEEEEKGGKEPQGIFWDFEKGFECFFAFQEIPIREVFGAFNGKWEASGRKNIQEEIQSGWPSSTALTFFNAPEMEVVLNEKKWCLAAKEIRRAGQKKMNKVVFKKACKEQLLNFLDFKETLCNVESYRWEINAEKLKKSNRLKFDQALYAFKCSKKIKDEVLVLENARIKDILNFIENRYYKKIATVYEKGDHPIWIGNYRFRKMEFPLDYSFDVFSEYLTQEYGIALKPNYGAFKGKAYSPKNFKEKDLVEFEDYEVYDYQDEYIKVSLRFSAKNRYLRKGKPITTNYEEVYIGEGENLNRVLEYLHYGIIRTGERTMHLNKEKEEPMFFQLDPYGQSVGIAAENLMLDEIEEEEFRRRVEVVLLNRLGIEKKLVDQAVYKCTYSLDRIKSLKHFSRIDTQNGKAIKQESNNNNRDTLLWNLRLPSDPNILLTLRIQDYNLLFEQTDWATYKLQVKGEIEESMEYKLSNLQLPRNDLDNLIFILEKKYGVSIVKTEKRKPVILYRTKK